MIKKLTASEFLRIALVAVFPLCPALMGCEFSTNPLILDGSVATAKFPVDVEIPSLLPPAFSIADSIDLGGVCENIDEVDSVKFYNLTFSFEGDTANLTTRITGTVTVNGSPMLVFDDVPLSAFSPERSIFKPTAGFSYDEAGISVLRQALASTAQDRSLHLSGDFQADGRSLHFTLQAKLYTQVFLRQVN